MPLFGPPNIEKLKRNRDVKHLIKALTYRDVSVQKAAVEALEEINEPTSMQHLVLWRKREAERERADVLREVRRLESCSQQVARLEAEIDRFERANPALAALSEASFVIRSGRSAAGAAYLERLRSMKKNLAAAQGRQRDLHRSIAKLAAEKPVLTDALAGMGAPAVEWLAAALKDEEQDVRRDAANALEHIGGAEAERALAEYRARQE